MGAATIRGKKVPEDPAQTRQRQKELERRKNQKECLGIDFNWPGRGDGGDKG